MIDSESVIKNRAAMGKAGKYVPAGSNKGRTFLVRATMGRFL